MHRGSCLGPAALVLMMFAPLDDALSQNLRLGTEFQVNQYTTQNQQRPVAASDADGNTVVTWSSFGQDGNGEGVFARRFASNGAASSEFQVNTATEGFQFRPWVASASTGAFVIVWHGLDGTSQGVFGQRFSSSGARAGVEFQVNTYTPTNQRYASVAAEPDGEFVVVWQAEDEDGGDDDVFGRRFSNSGVAQASEFLVNTYTTGVQQDPVVAVDAEGDFVVSWQRLSPTFHDVFARRFSSSGAAIGGEFLVNVRTDDNQRNPAIGVDANGAFVVTWQSTVTVDGSGETILARRFASSGAAIGGEFVVNAYSPDSQFDPAIAVEPDGEFLIVWTSFTQDDNTSDGVFGRLFTADGIPVNREFQVNTYTFLSQDSPSVAGGGGRFVVAWESSDGLDNGGVFGQRFVSPVPLDVDGNFLVDPLTDTILTLRYAFGFRGETLIDGAVGDNCTRCDAPSIEAYLLDLAN